MPKNFKNISEFKEAFDIAKQCSWDKNELEIYDYISLKEYDEIHALETATEKGMKKGIEKGIKQEKINSENKIKQEKINTAKILLKANVDLDVIASSTGISKSKIQKLIK